MKIPYYYFYYYCSTFDIYLTHLMLLCLIQYHALLRSITCYISQYKESGETCLLSSSACTVDRGPWSRRQWNPFVLNFPVSSGTIRNEVTSLFFYRSWLIPAMCSHRRPPSSPQSCAWPHDPHMKAGTATLSKHSENNICILAQTQGTQCTGQI